MIKHDEYVRKMRLLASRMRDDSVYSIAAGSIRYSKQDILSWADNTDTNTQFLQWRMSVANIIWSLIDEPTK